MMDPHVEHGGASSWFWIAANDDIARDEINGGGDAAVPDAVPAPKPVAIAAPATPFSTIQNQEDAPPCSTCGSIMVRSGSCYKCANCGTTSGCA